MHYDHINTFNRPEVLDKGRDNTTVHNYAVGGKHVEKVICRIFDEAIQGFVEVTVHWHQIIDFMERRQPLDLGPATVEAVIWYDGTRSYAKSWQRWNDKRGTWELSRIGAGAYGDSTCLKFEQK